MAILFHADPLAECLDYNEAVITWTNPVGLWSALRVVRNPNGIPVSFDDGLVLVNVTAPGAATYTDIEVTPGRRYYYGLFVFSTIDQAWVNAGVTDVLIIKDHSYAGILWDRLPNVYKLDSFANLTGIPNPSNPLRRFLDVFGFQLDEFRTEYDELLRLDAASVPESALPALLDQLGFTSEPELNPRARRRLAAGAVELYKDKGLQLSLENLTSILTDWDASVSIGPNKVLDNLDALTDLSFGRWDTFLVGCTLEARNNIASVSGPFGRGYTAAVATAATSPLTLSTSRVGRTGRLHSIPIIQGRTYAASIYLNGGTSAQLSIDWYGILGELITITAGATTVLTVGSWVRMSSVVMAPPGARYAAMRISTNKTQTLTEGGTGLTSFTLTLGGQTTTAIAASSTVAQIQFALENLSTVGAGNVRVTGPAGASTGPWTVSFIGALAGVDPGTLISAPTGGTGTVTVGLVGVSPLLLNAAQFEEVAPLGVPGPYKPARQALIALRAELVNEVPNPNGVGGIQAWEGATAGLTAASTGLLLQWSNGDQVSAGDRRYVAAIPRVNVEPSDTVTLFAEMRAGSIAENGVPFDAPFSVELDVGWHLRRFSGGTELVPHRYEDADLVRLTDVVSENRIGTALWQNVALQYTVPADGSVTAIEVGVAITRLRINQIGALQYHRAPEPNLCRLGGTGTLLIPLESQPPLPGASGFDAVRFRRVALVKGRFEDAFYFAGDSASPSAEYVWEGVPNNSRTHFYSRRGVKVQRLQMLAPQFLPHPQTHWLDGDTEESLGFITAAPEKQVYAPRWALINYEIAPAPSPVRLVGSSLEIDWARASQTWDTLQAGGATWGSVIASYPDWNSVSGA